ncbi:MAG: SAM-dependent DNA methyltransferase, partial [Candidatus Viridilinea halotolerans]
APRLILVSVLILYLTDYSNILAYHQASLPGMAATAPTPPVAIPHAGSLLLFMSDHFVYVNDLKAHYSASVRMQRAYAEWQRRVRGVYADPAREFCLQTGYIHFVRLFFARVCEDHHLIERRLSNGPFDQFDAYRQALLHGVSDVYARLLHESYERATLIYHNFFSRADLYDWFQIDERSILGILALLNRYDLSQLDFDLLGNIYNEGYIEEQRRSEHGQFYTPHAVVQYMVNSLNLFPQRAPNASHPLTAAERASVEYSVIDLSCGSGSFLVEIAGRKAVILQRMVNEGLIKPEEAIERIVETIAGIDLSPFACYLAEINLMMRCLPFLRTTHNGSLRLQSIKRTHIYCGDAIEPTLRERVDFHMGKDEAALQISLRDRSARPVRVSEEERLLQALKNQKAIPGRLMAGKTGFDVVLGNPPYVKANESAAQSIYRDRIRSWGIYTLRDKWDLFVPFVYRNLAFLAEGGWLMLLTTSAVESEGYAAQLRSDLLNFWVDQVDFFPKLQLFGKYVGVTNTIFQVQKRPGPNPAVRRRLHRSVTLDTYEERPMDQAQGPEAIFRINYRPPPAGVTTGCIPLCAIAYIGTGLEAHSHERHGRRVHGKRVLAFDLEASFRSSLEGLPPSEAAHFSDRGVLGAEVKDYHLTRKRFVAYDHMKGQMRRKRIPELFRTPAKLLLGETSGGYYDTEHLFANHSVQVVVPWHRLHLEECGVQKVRQNSMLLAGYNDLDTIAQAFDLRYILAVINSRYMRDYLLANQAQGTREGRIYPDVWKLLPVKVVAPAVQADIGQMVEELQTLHSDLQAIREACDIVARWRREGRLTGKLSDHLISGVLTVNGPLDQTRKSRYEREGLHLLLFEQHGLAVSDATATPLLDYICWYCNEINPALRGYPWAMLRSQIELPANLSALASFMGEVAALQQERNTAIERIAAKRASIEAAVVAAYEHGADHERWQTLQGLRQGS